MNKQHPNKGKIPWNKGKKGVQIVSDETRKKLSIARMGNKNRVGCKPWCTGTKGEVKAWNKGLKGFMAGEQSPRWKGGITSENKSARSSVEYREWRISVFERDGYTCQICTEVGGKLEAHHIKSFAKFPDKRFEIDNGVTMCLECHKLTDNYKGKCNGTIQPDNSDQKDNSPE